MTTSGNGGNGKDHPFVGQEPHGPLIEPPNPGPKKNGHDDPDAEIARLRGLSQTAYEAERKEVAKKLGIRLRVLDRLTRNESGYADGNARKGAGQGRQAPGGPTGGWYSKCLTGRDGRTLSNLSNTLLALREDPAWKALFIFDALFETALMPRQKR
jgi:hypothetical protein